MEDNENRKRKRKKINNSFSDIKTQEKPSKIKNASEKFLLEKPIKEKKKKLTKSMRKNVLKNKKQLQKVLLDHYKKKVENNNSSFMDHETSVNQLTPRKRSSSKAKLTLPRPSNKIKRRKYNQGEKRKAPYIKNPKFQKTKDSTLNSCSVN